MPRKLADYIEEADYPENIYADLHAAPGSPTWLLYTRVRRLDSIVSKLRNNAYAPAMKLFGSAAEDDGKIPNDLDVFIDTREFKLDKQIAVSAFNEILEISNQYRGLLHPYVLINGKLYTRDDDGRRWVKATNPTAMIAAGKKGLPLTLFNKNFTSMTYRALSESNSIMHYVKKVEESRSATRMFQGYELPARLFEHYSEWEIALMLGGH